jgi:ankyrin repeat protein
MSDTSISANLCNMIKNVIEPSDYEYLQSHDTVNLGQDLILLTQKYELLVDVVKKYFEEYPNDLCYVNNSNGHSILHASCAQTATNVSIEMIQVLLEICPDINLKDKLGNSPLMYAIQNLNKGCTVETVMLMLNNPNIDVNSVNNFDMSCLFFAVVQENCFDIIRKIIDRGCNLKQVSIYKMNVLHHLAKVKKDLSIDIIQYLLHCGVDFDVVDTYGKYPLDYIVA